MWEIVLSYTNKRLDFKVDPEWSLEELFQKVEDLLDVPTTNMKLIVAGKGLQNVPDQKVGTSGRGPLIVIDLSLEYISFDYLEQLRSPVKY